MNEPQELPTRPEKPEGASRNRRMFVPVLLLLAFVAAGSAYATWELRRWRFDPAPPKRPWIDAPYIQTPMSVVEKMLEVAEVKESDVLYDLGCGDGRMAIVAAETYGCRSVGFDIDPERIRDSRTNAETRGVQDLATFEERDVFTLDLSQCDVAAIYLLPRYLMRLVPQFQAMRPGSRIVVHDFGIEGVEPDKTIEFIDEEKGENHYIKVWITPLKVPPDVQKKIAEGDFGP
jgi:SAM-dependent methyltransferase